MQTILVTGASSGMGKAMAGKLIREGHTVYAAARRLDRMRDLEDLGAIPLQMDITRDDDIVAVVDRIASGHGGVDVLVNNAGFGSYGSVEDTILEDARYQFEVNLFGLARLTQLVVPFMREQHGGKIVNISSMGGRSYTPMGAWYHATKYALEGWSDCLRLELKQFGIDVIIIEPGIIETEFADVMTESLLVRSGETVYADLAQRVANATRRIYAPGRGSPATRVAEVVAEAIAARHPKTRYPVGRYARLMINSRKWLPDRLFDRMIMMRSARD